MIAWTDVEYVDGELVELGLHRSGKREPTLAEKKQFLAELKDLRKPGWKQGWAAAKFRERYGHWPSSRIVGVFPTSLSLATRNWLTSRQIAWAKGRAHG